MITARTRAFDSVLCFGDSDWWYHNRGHADMQFMRRFARHWPVLYVNSLGMKTPGASDGRMFLRRVSRKAKSVARYYRKGGEGFGVLSPIFLPVFDGAFGHSLTRALGLQITAALRALGMHRPLVWVACPSAVDVLDKIPRGGLVYQLSDCYSALRGASATQAARMEAALAQQADLVVCSSLSLVERARHLYRRGEYVDHGVDFDRFAAAGSVPDPPEEVRDLPSPIVGFFGNLDGNTVDRALLDAIIRSRPEYRFVLVGPMSREFESLRAHGNLTHVPQKPYCEIARYGAAFDVAIMPWLRNEWIHHCNPIKLKEYLSLGKPVVSTPFPELRRCGGLCYEATDAVTFAAAIDRALAEDDPARRAERRAWASPHTWDAKFGRILRLLEIRGISCFSESCPRSPQTRRHENGGASRIYACGKWAYAPPGDPMIRCMRCCYDDVLKRTVLDVRSILGRAQQRAPLPRTRLARDVRRLAERSFS
ncbi:MAG: glycosyltransferase [Phycisphaerae bacterium]|nr:glycosyltransferase [Phycisphaerae bacterium]